MDSSIPVIKTENTLKKHKHKSSRVNLKSSVTEIVNTHKELIKKYNIQKILKEKPKKAVYLVTDNTNAKYIMKVKKIKFLRNGEIDIWKKVFKNPHPNILKIKDIYKSNIILVIIYEYIDGFDISNKNNYHLYNDNIENIFKETLLGIDHLHKIGVCHNDIHWKNIMIKKSENTYIPIIIDFDISLLLKPMIHKTPKKRRDVWKTANVFHNYIFHEELEKDKNFRIINQPINNYDTHKHYRFINILNNILSHDIFKGPRIKQVLELLNQ